METFSVNELADITKRVGTELGYTVEVKNIDNPRNEAENHYYNPVYHGLKDIGVTPHYLTDEVMADLFRTVAKYQNNIRKDVIFRGVKW